MKHHSSFTAKRMGFLRALEHTQPAHQRILVDPYAARFLRFPGLALIACRPVLARSWFDWGTRRAGVPGAPTRLVDETVLTGCAAGLQQLVSLGAGFDTLS